MAESGQSSHSRLRRSDCYIKPIPASSWSSYGTVGFVAIPLGNTKTDKAESGHAAAAHEVSDAQSLDAASNSENVQDLIRCQDVLLELISESNVSVGSPPNTSTSARVYRVPVYS